MLKKVVGFICPVDKAFDLSSINGPLGGAETWTIQMAKEFAKNGYHVIIFNKSDYNMIYSNDIEIVKITEMHFRLSYQYFTHIFILRYFEPETLELIKQYNCCENIYYILHDMFLWKNKGAVINNDYFITNYGDFYNNEWYKKHVKHVFVMSDWHKEVNNKYYNNDDFVKILGNGTSVTPGTEVERDNSMLWSSCYNRGLDILVEKIAPLVIKEIPDFKIYTLTYDSNSQINTYTDLDYVEDLGSMNKTDLYNEIAKHKVWFYPCVHWETFCITVLENIINDVQIIVPCKYGIKTTLKYFEDVLLEDGDYENEEYCQFVASKIIDAIKNYNDENKKTIRNIMKKYVIDNYSWDNIFNKLHQYIITYEKDNSNNS